MRLRSKDFRSLADLNREEILGLIDLALRSKREMKKGTFESPVPGRFLGLIFHKPSLRTRVSFERAMHDLGGTSIMISDREIGIGTREDPRDVARVLSRFVHGIMIRTFDQAMVDRLASEAGVPVINGLTDLYHPCQILADLLTVKERRGSLEDLRVVFVGDGNNVCHSWILAAAHLGIDLRLACPEGYSPDPRVLETARGIGPLRFEESRDPARAVAGAHVIYTDTWTSMGQEEDAERRRRAFAPFQVNENLLGGAERDAVVLHCLPAHRGEEITDEVIDGPRSAVYDQAENRTHAQRALLTLLFQR
jgi:ornithine carbamoyltransferase